MFSGSVLLPGSAASADGTLRTSDGGSFKVHRAYLSNVSPYFEALFSEAFGAEKDVVIRRVSAAVLDALLTFEYTGKLCVNSHNILEVLRVADMLLMEEARKECLLQLPKKMRIDNCLGLATNARQYYSPSNSDTVLAFLRGNFDEIWQRSKEFVNTPGWLMYELLSSPELNVEREEHVLHAIAKWWMSGSSAAALDGNVLRQLLQCVRIGRCDKEALDKFARRWPLLVNNAEYRDSIVHALMVGPCLCQPNKLMRALLETDDVLPTAHAAAGNAPIVADNLPKVVFMSGEPVPEIAEEPEEEYVPSDMKQPSCETCGLSNAERWMPRVPNEVIVVLGGWRDERPQRSVEVLDPHAKRWFQYKDPDFMKRAYHGVVLLNRRLYIVGGRQTRRFLRSTKSFGLDEGYWDYHALMEEPRGYVAVAALRGNIYAMGGHNGVERISSVERYCASKDKWTRVASMICRRSGASACAYRGRLYISGGFNGTEVLDSVEQYSPSLDSWVLLRPLPNPRSSHRMINHGGRIYVIGGLDGGLQRLATVLRSNEESPLTWEEAPSLNSSRSAFGVATLGNVIYVIGGFHDDDPVRSVECYTPGEQRWIQAPSLNAPVSALAACAVSGINATRKFSARGILLPAVKPQPS